jgi:cytochrome c5
MAHYSGDELMKHSIHRRIPTSCGILWADGPLFATFMGISIIGLLVGVVVSITAGCQSPRRDEPIIGAMPLGDHRVARGQEVFFANCHQCHPGGSAGLGPAINDKPVPEWLLKTQVRVGLGAMPGFSKEQISDVELQALADYVLELRHAL